MDGCQGRFSSSLGRSRVRQADNLVYNPEGDQHLRTGQRSKSLQRWQEIRRAWGKSVSKIGVWRTIPMIAWRSGEIRESGVSWFQHRRGHDWPGKGSFHTEAGTTEVCLPLLETWMREEEEGILCRINLFKKMVRRQNGRQRQTENRNFSLLLRPPGEYLTNSGEVRFWPKAGYGDLWFTCGKFLHRQILSFSLPTALTRSQNPADLRSF